VKHVRTYRCIRADTIIQPLAATQYNYTIASPTVHSMLRTHHVNAAAPELKPFSAITLRVVLSLSIAE